MFQTILRASDGSANGERALALALQLDASLPIVHVLEKLPGRFNWHRDEDRPIVRLKAHTAALHPHGLDAWRPVIRAGTSHAAELIADAAAAISDVVSGYSLATNAAM